MKEFDEDDPKTIDERSPFIRMLLDQRHEQLIHELDASLLEAVTEVARLGKKGTLTLVIGVDPQGRTVVVSDDLKVKLPQEPRTAEIYYHDAEGRLTRDDPYAIRMPMGKTVNNLSDGTIREIDHDTGKVRIINAAGEVISGAQNQAAVDAEKEAGA